MRVVATGQGRVRVAAAAALVAAVLAALPRGAAAAEPQGPPEPGRCHALLIGGLPGEELFARHYRDWLTRFHAYLTRTAGVPPENVVVLSGDEAFKDPIVRGPATAESVRKALADAAAKVRPQDQFILMLVGHGVLAEEVPTLALRGPDLSARDLADGLASVPAANQVVLNFTSASGASVPVLARKDRVNVAATSPIEGNETVFAEFFLRGLESRRADGEGAPDAGAKDGTVTLLEAYNWAAREAALWISRLSVTESGAWRIDGKESVEVFEKLYAGPEGMPGTRRLAPESDRTKPDAPVVISPPDGQIDESWLARRVLSEHATLEDAGRDMGVSAIGKDGYAPVAGRKEGEPGSLARRTVLGRADRLPAE